ncbi:MAG: hypothetical protein K1X92_08135 [Bacteroidia bacterium]|nr:hypothetical protein [Bacteroidia bacterium]
MKFTLTHQYTLPDIASASVAEYYDSCLLILGDDSNILFQTTPEGKILKKIPLQPGGLTGIPKKQKPDWEGGTMIFVEDKPYFLAAGSGSDSPQRDNAMMLEVASENPPVVFSLSRLYEKLKEDKNIQQLNIESLFTFQNKVLLINRGGLFQPNHLIIPDFFLPDTGTAEIQYHLVTIESPLIQGFQSGISGAVYDEASNSLIVCASAENTSDTYNDGEIIGSVLGRVADFSEKISSNEIRLEEIAYSEPVLNQKIESLCITNDSGDENLQMIAVSDNDGKHSELFHITLHR